MKQTVFIDANVVIRFLLSDHPTLSSLAKSIFRKAQEGILKIYLDEVVFAEIVWTLSSYYKIKKIDMINQLETLISQDWIINPRKKIILEALNLFRFNNLDYIDCWVFIVSKSKELTLETFDKSLKKLK